MTLYIKANRYFKLFKFYDRQKFEYWLRTKQSLKSTGKEMKIPHIILNKKIRRNVDNRQKYHNTEK